MILSSIGKVRICDIDTRELIEPEFDLYTGQTYTIPEGYTILYREFYHDPEIEKVWCKKQ